MSEKYVILLTGGQLIDPKNNINSIMDIAIKDGVRHTTIQVECAGCDQTDCDEVSNCTIVNTHQCIVEDAESLQTALSVLEADDNDDLNTRLL